MSMSTCMFHSFTTKSGKTATVRSSSAHDYVIAREFINTASAEDTYLTFSGEQLTDGEERAYLADCDMRIATGDLVKLFCFIDGVLVGDITIGRDVKGRKRSYHCATLGIVVHHAYRGDGIGRALIRIALEEAKQKITGLRIVTLWYLEPNQNAKMLYESCGFKECGRVPGGMWYRDTYVDHVHMMKRV